jgi:hypothetical protein
MTFKFAMNAVITDNEGNYLGDKHEQKDELDNNNDYNCILLIRRKRV